MTTQAETTDSGFHIVEMHLMLTLDDDGFGRYLRHYPQQPGVVIEDDNEFYILGEVLKGAKAVRRVD